MNKSVFIIMPTFHGFEISIKEMLEELDYKVVHFFYDEMNSYRYSPIKLFVVALLFPVRIFSRRNFKLQKQANYVIHRMKDFGALNEDFLELIKSQRMDNYSFDYILFIKGFGFNKENIRILKEYYPASKLILYQWDSLTRFPNVINIYPLFDEVWTFDPMDTDEFPGSRFLPTFFLPIKIPQDELAIDKNKYPEGISQLSYVGTFTIVRFIKLLRIIAKLKKASLTYNFNLISRFNLEFLSKNGLKITNQKISPADVYKMYAHSSAILELGHEGQTGLTTRFFEAAYLKRLYVTEKKTLFFLTDHLHQENFSFCCTINEFILFKGKYNVVDFNSSLVNEFSLKNWLCKILKK